MKSQLFKYLACPLLLFGLISCSSPSHINPAVPIQPIDKGEPVLKNSKDYLTFWNPNTKIDFHISLSKEATNFLNSYQTNHNDSTYFDYYVPCTFTLTMNEDEFVFDEVGIRVKGNLSRTTFLRDGKLNENSLCHFKLSFKETFDDEEYQTIEMLRPFYIDWQDQALRKGRKSRTLFDMEKIDIKWNRNNDQTRVKSCYMLKTFLDNGVIAGRSTLAKTTLSILNNNSITAIYEVLECIDSILIKRFFDAEKCDGDLYKCTWQNAQADFSKSYKVGVQIGIEDNSKNYHPAYDLKTNKKKSIKHEDLLNLFAVINDKSSSASEWKTKAEQFIDFNDFLMYEAIAFLCGNFDDFRNNANNYYLYITSTTKKAYFIPYDFDRGLGMGCEGIQNFMTDFSAESTKQQCSRNWQSCNLFWRTICQTNDISSSYKNVERVEDFRSIYQKNIENLLNKKIISDESFTGFVNSFPLDYQLNSKGSGTNNTSFSNYLKLKIEAIKKYNKNYQINV